jgi:hypothetical protein
VLKVYVVKSSRPDTKSKSCGGTIKWMNPFFVQMEQLQTAAVDKSARTTNRTRPQWHPPSNRAFVMACPSNAYWLARFGGRGAHCGRRRVVAHSRRYMFISVWYGSDISRDSS